MTAKFADEHILPFQDQWERDGQLPRELHRKAADVGLLGVPFPEEVGGGGGDIIDAMVVAEELGYRGVAGGVQASLFTHSIAVPHIAAAGDPDQIEIGRASCRARSE